MKKIALLGATGYIGKSLTEQFFLHGNEYSLCLFSRNKDTLNHLLAQVERNGAQYSLRSLDEFSSERYDVIINCTGIGDPKVLRQTGASIFSVTEEVDTLILSYLEKHPDVQYINMSSGAVYGSDFSRPVTKETVTSLSLNASTPYEFYSIAKFYQEAKHRAHKHFHIFDLRIFSFFSHFALPGAGFLLSEMVDCLENKKVFLTTDQDIVRDFVTPFDLFALIDLIIKEERGNDFYDLYSLGAVSKFEIMDLFEKQYGLKCEIRQEEKVKETKNTYFSENKKAGSLGYAPKYTSLSGIECEMSKRGF